MARRLMVNLPAGDLDHVLEHTGAIWDDLRGGRLFITGATCFFGKWLLESFLWANERRSLAARAVVLTREPAAFRAGAPHLASHPCIELFAGDVRSFVPPVGPFTHVIHAATPSNFHDEDPQAMLDQAYQGTRRVLDFARDAGADKVL